MQEYHVPVLLQEVIAGLNLKSGHIVVDCTVGGGGHSLEIVKKILPHGKLIAIDKDEEALNAARSNLSNNLENVIFVRDDFKNIRNILEKTGIWDVDAILIDLGVSSHQLDDPSRGFSYMHDAPLDMRMDRRQDLTAEVLVNKLSEKELYKIIKEYGEERWAKKIAATIVKRRKQKPITTSLQLVEIIKEAIPARTRKDGPHPAKRTFQALRIAVNKELTGLEKTLEEAVDLLKQGGRVAVISFHSLEDRIVKTTFNKLARDCICPPGLPICKCDHRKTVNVITRKPIIASAEEREKNPRARSAKLRIAEKLTPKPVLKKEGAEYIDSGT